MFIVIFISDDLKLLNAVERISHLAFETEYVLSSARKTLFTASFSGENEEYRGNVDRARG